MRYLSFLLAGLLYAQAPAPSPIAGGGSGGSGGGGCSTGTGVCTVVSGTPTVVLAITPTQAGLPDLSNTSGVSAHFAVPLSVGDNSTSGAFLLPGKTSGNSVTITVTDTTATGTLTAPGGLTATIMPFTGAFANGDCVKAAVSGTVTSFITAGSGCAAGNPGNYWTSGAFTCIGPTSCTSTATLTVFDATSTTGFTQFLLKSGANQESGSLTVMSVLDATGAQKFRMRDVSSLDFRIEGQAFADISADAFILQGQTQKLGNQFVVNWTNAAFWFSTVDTGLSRCAAGVLCIGTGSQGSLAGALRLAYAATEPIATSSLPTCTATTGIPWRASVNDATVPALGVVLTGGGSTFANVHCSRTTGTYLVDGL